MLVKYISLKGKKMFLIKIMYIHLLSYKFKNILYFKQKKKVLQNIYEKLIKRKENEMYKNIIQIIKYLFN